MELVQPGEEALYRSWATIRARLEVTLGTQSELPPALAAYAIDHSGHLRLLAVDVLREEYGVSGEPPAEDLLSLLQLAVADAASWTQTAAQPEPLPLLNMDDSAS